MYTNLKEFQDHATQFLTYLENVKDKKVVLYGVQLSMDELKKWQAEEKDAPKDFPRMIEKENQLNYASSVKLSSNKHNTRERHHCLL
jgi:hypothetical protein